jgi:hypothetical protein
MISQGRMLPKALSAKVASGSMKLAKVNSLGRGYVLDYVSINANQTNFTFQGDTTYYINGTYYLSGTTILEGGAVLKYNTNSTVNVLEGIQCSTAPYHPAVFTSANDNTLCGSTESTVPGSSQNMQPATEAVTMLSLAQGGNLHDIRICNATVGIVTSGGNMCWITNAQFVNCTIAMKMENAYQYAGNILMSKVGTGFYGQNYQAIAENLTYDQGALLTGDEDGSSTTSIMTLNNALLTGVASYGVVPLTTNCVVTLSTNTGIYQTVGGGSYYLATNTPYRSAGTSNIDSGVLAALVKERHGRRFCSATSLFTCQLTLPRRPRATTVPIPIWGIIMIPWTTPLGDAMFTPTFHLAPGWPWAGSEPVRVGIMPDRAFTWTTGKSAPSMEQRQHCVAGRDSTRYRNRTRVAAMVPVASPVGRIKMRRISPGRRR